MPATSELVMPPEVEELSPLNSSGEVVAISSELALVETDDISVLESVGTLAVGAELEVPVRSDEVVSVALDAVDPSGSVRLLSLGLPAFVGAPAEFCEGGGVDVSELAGVEPPTAERCLGVLGI